MAQDFSRQVICFQKPLQEKQPIRSILEREEMALEYHLIENILEFSLDVHVQ